MTTSPYGIISLIPPIVAFSFAVWSRKTFEGLILGAVTGFIIATKGAFVSTFIENSYKVLADEGTIWVFLACGLFGSLIALLEKSKGSEAFADLIMKYFKSEKATLFATWLLGCFIFMDDYLSALTVGTTMRKVTDERGIPRETLAYIADATAAPICLLIPLSTWVVFWSGIFNDQPEWGGKLGSGMAIYLKSLPFVFYSYVSMIVLLLFLFKMLPPLGTMKDAYKRVNESGQTYSPESAALNFDHQLAASSENEIEGKLMNFVLPIVVLIAVSVWQDDLLVGVLYSIVACMILYLPTRTMNLDDFCTHFSKGFADMLPMLFMCFGAFMFREAASLVGMPAYVVGKATPFMNHICLPAVTFIVLGIPVIFNR